MGVSLTGSPCGMWGTHQAGRSLSWGWWSEHCACMEGQEGGDGGAAGLPLAVFDILPLMGTDATWHRSASVAPPGHSPPHVRELISLAPGDLLYSNCGPEASCNGYWLQHNFAAPFPSRCDGNHVPAPTCTARWPVWIMLTPGNALAVAPSLGGRRPGGLRRCAACRDAVTPPVNCEITLLFLLFCYCHVFPRFFCVFVCYFMLFW